MSENWTLKSVLDWAAADFRLRGMESPRLEAEVLLCHVLDYERIKLYTDFDRPMSAPELTAFKGLITRRRGGEPSAYITGKQEFWSLAFAVAEGVLIPRPDTETLVEAALEKVPPEGGALLDLCTGSGCVAIAIAATRPGFLVDAVDLSPIACDLARRNVTAHGLEDRVTILEGNLYDPLCAQRRYDLIVSNPPYVTEAQMATLQAEVRREPVLALDGGQDGLRIIRSILESARDHMTPTGVLMVELDPRQAQTVARDLGPLTLGVEGTIINDLTGRGRVVSFRVGD